MVDSIRIMRATERTTIAIDTESGKQIRQIAEARRINVINVPRLLLEGWNMLTPKQQAEAMLRYSNLHERKLVTA